MSARATLSPSDLMSNAWTLVKIHGSSIVLSTVILGVLYLVVYCVYNLFFHPLASFPGPRHRAAIKIPYLAGMWSGHHHRIVKKLHDQYGPVVRISPNNLSYITAQAWKDIYAHKKSRDLEMIKDPEFYVRNPNAPSIVNGNHDDHARYRRLYSPGFSARSLREQEPLIQRYVTLFVNGLTRKCEHGEVAVDMVQWFNYVTFDIIGDLAFGEPFGCLEDGENDWLQALNQIEEATMRIRVVQHAPLLGWYARKIVNTFLSNDAMKGAAEHLDLTQDKVRRRMNNDAYRPDFMEHILRQPEGKGFSWGEMLSNSATLIQAGSETTATLLSGAVFLLCQNPDKLKKLVDELQGAFESEDQLTIDNTIGFTYLDAVLEETLRCYSPAVPGFPRQVPKSGAMIDGRWVPGGMSVTVNHYAAYHSTLNFDRPEEFIPERFIDLDAFSNDRRDVLQPFSMGPRNCIGKTLAYAEGRLILGRFLLKFDMRLSDEAQTWMDQKGYVTWMRPELKTFIKLRER